MQGDLKSAEHTFNAIQAGENVIDIPFGGDSIALHEKFDHRIETDCFFSAACHRSSLASRVKDPGQALTGN